MKPDFINTENELNQFLNRLSEKGIKRIALDFEGDQGTVHYHNRISIIQIFDGEKSFIIDVLAFDKVEPIRKFLSSTSIQKVMFASTNDQYMCQNVLDCNLMNVRDIAVAQKLLGEPINIANFIGIEKHDKDMLQRANWIRRPLTDELIEYAINDVLDLLKLEKSYTEKLQNNNLLMVYKNACADLPNHNYRLNPLYIYSRRIGSYAHMNSKKQLDLRTIWIFRELIGEFTDRPVGHLFSKKLMPFWVRKGVDPREEILQTVNRRLRRDKQLSEADCNRLWNEAAELAENAPF